MWRLVVNCKYIRQPLRQFGKVRKLSIFNFPPDLVWCVVCGQNSGSKFYPFPVFGWPISVDSGVYALVFPALLYPLNNISICCSIGLTLAISIER